MRAESSDAPLSVGIDLGTQGVQVVLLGIDGKVAATGTAPLKSIRLGVRHEQDPEGWWKAIGRAARQATAELGGREVSGLAICSTSGTFLLADTSGNPFTPAFMYNDGRAKEESTLVQEVGAELWDSLGYRMQPSFALPKLLWVLRSGVKGASRLMHQADYVASRLAGKPVATDWSHALKTGYDLVNDCWPVEVLERLEIPVKLLPPVVRPGTRVGEVSEAAAEYTGVPAGTPILSGMTDGCAAQIAAGALKEGQWNSVLGTTLTLKGVTNKLLKDPTGAVYCHRHPDDGWLPGGASNTGARIISEKFPDYDVEELDKKAKQHGPAKMVMYPLAGEGERFPFANPKARGFRLGEPEDETDYYRAILEGVAFVERLCFVHLESLGAEVSGPVALAGGGARSAVWAQIRADVLGMPVVIPRYSGGAVGMAILAHAGGGSVTETATRMSQVGSRFEPCEDCSVRLADNFDQLVQAFVERGYISEDLAKRARMP
ncbi:MAG: hypothetical protein K6T51_03345 [Rubrobacteraceae bacterium]|nr:hypothetical protein [Rubrobacteraceae bacterium]